MIHLATRDQGLWMLIAIAILTVLSFVALIVFVPR